MLNSHLLSEIEMTCDQVAIIKNGQVIRQGKIDDLLAAPSTVSMRILNVTPALIHTLESMAQTVHVEGEQVTAGISDEDHDPRDRRGGGEDRGAVDVAGSDARIAGRFIYSGRGN